MPEFLRLSMTYDRDSETPAVCLFLGVISIMTLYYHVAIKLIIWLYIAQYPFLFKKLCICSNIVLNIWWSVKIEKSLTKLFLSVKVKFLIIIHLKMKNMINTLNKLTKLLAVAIISVSLNAFSNRITSIRDGNRCNSSSSSGTNMISADGDEWV
jgi:hypothetical protein